MPDSKLNLNSMNDTMIFLIYIIRSGKVLQLELSWQCGWWMRHRKTSDCSYTTASLALHSISNIKVLVFSPRKRLTKIGEAAEIITVSHWSCVLIFSGWYTMSKKRKQELVRVGGGVLFRDCRERGGSSTCWGLIV